MAIKILCFLLLIHSVELTRAEAELESRDKRGIFGNLIGSGLGHIGNFVWSYNMQRSHCRDQGFCNTQLCLEAEKVSGVGGIVSNAAASVTGLIGTNYLPDETVKAACEVNGMYEEPKPKEEEPLVPSPNSNFNTYSQSGAPPTFNPYSQYGPPPRFNPYMRQQ